MEDKEFLNCLKLITQFEDKLWENLKKYFPTLSKTLEEMIPNWVKRYGSENPYHSLIITEEFFSASHLDKKDHHLAPAIGYFCNYLQNNTAGEFIFPEHNIILPFNPSGTLLIWYGSSIPHATGLYENCFGNTKKKRSSGHLGTSFQIKKSFFSIVNKKNKPGIWKTQDSFIVNNE